jgi:hypothetical protein
MGGEIRIVREILPSDVMLLGKIYSSEIGRYLAKLTDVAYLS